MQCFFQRQQYLVGVYRLYQVIGYLASYGLIHDVLLLALGNHDDGGERRCLLYHGERFKSRQSGHVLVEYYQIVTAFGNEVESVATVVGGRDIISFSVKEEDMGLQQVYFIVGP